MRPQAVHWESWLLRLVLVGIAGFQLGSGNRDGALVAVEGIAVSLLPILVQRLSRLDVPRAIELAFVTAMALQFGSESTKLFESLYYWDKVVHPTLIALTAMMAGWILLGYGEAFGVHIPIHFAALFGWLFGASIGAFWEFVEFFIDWLGNADLQKSNGDTMTDMLSNDIGASIATLIGMWLYFHVVGSQQRRQMGQIGLWLTCGLGKLLDDNGRVVAGVLAILVAILLGTTQWVDRDIPVLAASLAPGQSEDWSFARSLAIDPPDIQVLSGTWQSDSRAGICNINLDHSG